MNELSSFFRTNSEMIAKQCFTRLEEAKRVREGDKKKCLAMALGFAATLAESIKENDPEVFICSLGPYLKKSAERGAIPYLPDIIAAIEETAMARECTAAEMRFLWSLFSRARTVILRSSFAGRSSAKKPKDSAIETAENTLLKLQNEIDERREVEKKLRESERRFRELAESMPQVIFEVDEKGTINFVNKQAFEFFGYKEDDFSGEINCFAHIAPEEFPRMMANLHKIAEGAPSTGNKYTAIKKDGSLFPVSTHVTRIMKDGRLAGYRGIIIDITERVKIEEELTQSKRFLQGIADSIPGVIFQFYARANGEMGISYLSGSSKELFGIDVDAPDAFGQFLQGLMPSCRERFLDSIREVIRKECGWEFEGEFNKPSGETIYFVGMSSPVKNGDTLTFNGVVLDITTRKQLEEVLREEERKFRDIAELTPQVIFELAADGKITFVNKQGLELFGFTEEEIRKGVSAYDLFPGPERDAAHENIRKTISGERGTKGYEYTVQRKDGGIFPVIIYTTAILKDGRPTGFRGVLVDITQLKNTEEELRKSERRFRDLAESMPQTIFEMDEKGMLTFANRQAFEIYGYSDEDFRAGIDGLGLIAPQDLPRMKEGLRKIAEGGPPTGNEYTAIKKDGSLFPVSTHVVRIMKDGRLAGYRGIIIDITEKKKAEEELNMYFSNSLDLFCIADTDGYFRRLNKAWETTLGYPLEELEGRSFLDLVHPDDMDATLQAISRLGQQLKVTNFTNRYRCKDGSYRFIEWKSSPSGKRIFAAARDITDWKLAEKALKQGEKRLRQIIDLVPHFIFAKDIDGRFILVNKAVADAYGTTVEGLIGKTDAQFSPSDKEVDHFLKDDMEVIKTGTSKYIPEEPITDSQGKQRYLQTVKIPFTFSGTDTPAVLGVSVDITESKRAEEVLRLNESRTEALLKLNQMGDKPLGEITDYTLEESVRLTNSAIGYIAFLNDDETILTMHSWSKSAMRECRIENKTIEYPLATTGLWGEPVRQKKPVITNNYMALDPLKKGYPEGHVDVKRHLGVPVIDGEKIVAVVGVGNKEGEYNESDISQLTLMTQGMLRLVKQKTAQEALSISESRLRAIIESAKDSIFIKGTNHRYIVANNAMSELFGIPVDEIIGKHDRELFGSVEAASHIEKIDSRVLKGETIEEERPRPIGNIIHTFHTIKVPLRNDRGEIVGLCGIARDITERKHLEAQLLHSQKMEAVGTLAGGVAHDFNNLLSAIMGYASLLQMKISRDGPLFSYVSHILTSSEKAANLTHSLLAFSRKQVINLKPISINDTVEKLHNLLKRLIPEDVEFGIAKAAERLIAMGDSGQLDQVIMNLATNARDAMPQGGKLTISVGRAVIDNEFIMVHGYGKPGEYALINVSDTGVGMDEKTADKIFEPFFTTKEVGKGTGLGLAIVYGIVKQHNGYINVKSKPGEGSTFSVYLPLVWLEPAAEETVEQVDGGTETILIAEDNDELRELSHKVLSDNGYVVLSAKDGTGAVEVFREHRSDIALAILDVVMPNMNGKEVYEEIKKLDPSIKVIFTSGYTDDIIQEKGVTDGAYDFLGKPITPNALLKKIREVLDRKPR